jgi:hypothetical protein
MSQVVPIVCVADDAVSVCKSLIGRESWPNAIPCRTTEFRKKKKYV